MSANEKSSGMITITVQLSEEDKKILEDIKGRTNLDFGKIAKAIVMTELKELKCYKEKYQETGGYQEYLFDMYGKAMKLLQK
jgi:hypothetical protein